MKNLFKPTILPLFTLCAGVLGFLLRIWLYATGVDEKGLIITSHPANALIFILTALVIAVLFLCTRSLNAKHSYSELFPGSKTGAAGCFAAAAGILVTDTVEIFLKRDPITTATLILGLAAAACLLFLGFCRLKQLRPSFLFHTVVTVYMMLHPLSQYRLWSSDPQLQNYCFQLLASVFLLLACYHRTALDVKGGNCKWYALYNQAALFFCCLSLNTGSWLFYLTMAVWTATNLCSLKISALPEEA